VVFAGMSYFVVSAQGSFEALRSKAEIVHFTHYTVGHAHLGMYGFFSMMMFGAFYFMMPRLTGREWASPGLIRVHFWGSALGIATYFVGMTAAGVEQGLLLLDPTVPFVDVVKATLPYLQLRSVSGTAMTIAHVAFAVNLGAMLLHRAPVRDTPTLLATTA